MYLTIFVCVIVWCIVLLQNVKQKSELFDETSNEVYLVVIYTTNRKIKKKKISDGPSGDYLYGIK